MSLVSLEKKALRSELRQRRARLPPNQRRVAAHALIKHFNLYAKRTHISDAAFYWPVGPEIDPRPLMRTLHARGCRCHLPVLVHHYDRLAFHRWRPGIRLWPNRFGIPEPRQGKAIRPDQINIIFMPLVGFGPSGERLGMGGGYYDRTLARLRRRPRGHRPRMIGLAHQCQFDDRIQADPWDVPLDAVLTDQMFWQWRSRD
jgi:5-formyltetrahydrofolate cyclo-ligase